MTESTKYNKHVILRLEGPTDRLEAFDSKFRMSVFDLKEKLAYRTMRAIDQFIDYAQFNFNFELSNKDSILRILLAAGIHIEELGFFDDKPKVPTTYFDTYEEYYEAFLEHTRQFMLMKREPEKFDKYLKERNEKLKEKCGYRFSQFSEFDVLFEYRKGLYCADNAFVGRSHHHIMRIKEMYGTSYDEPTGITLTKNDGDYVYSYMATGANGSEKFVKHISSLYPEFIVHYGIVGPEKYKTNFKIFKRGNKI